MTSETKSQWKTALHEGETFPAHLVAMYDYMEAMFKKYQRYPTTREMVDAGYASSTSVVRYYYRKMAQYHMLIWQPTVARGTYLFPRKNWDPNMTGDPEKLQERFEGVNHELR